MPASFLEVQVIMDRRKRALPEWQIKAMSHDMAENPYRFAVTYDLDDYYSFFEVERRRVRWAACRLLLGVFGKIAGLTLATYLVAGIEVAAPLCIGVVGLKIWFLLRRYGSLQNFAQTWKFLVQPNPLPPPAPTGEAPDVAFSDEQPSPSQRSAGTDNHVYTPQ